MRKPGSCLKKLVVGHMKNNGRLARCYLKGAVGNVINIVMIAAGHNLSKILNKHRLLWFKIMFNLIRNFITLSKPTALNQELFQFKTGLFRLN